MARACKYSERDLLAAAVLCAGVRFLKTLLCSAACPWPCEASGKALLMAQVDQLAGVRSTSSTLSVVCLSVTHSGRAGTVSLVGNLDMVDITAVASTQMGREDLLVSSNQSTGSSHDGDFVGQLISAAVVDSEECLVAVLLHCGTMTRSFVAQVDTDGQDVTVMSTVLTMENSLEVWPFSFSKLTGVRTCMPCPENSCHPPSH